MNPDPHVLRENDPAGFISPRGLELLADLFPFLHHCAHLVRGVQFRFDMFQAEPRQHSQEIRRDQNLPVAIRPRADADGDAGFAIWPSRVLSLPTSSQPGRCPIKRLISLNQAMQRALSSHSIG